MAHAQAQAQVEGICRGEGYGYVALSLSDDIESGQLELSAHSQSGYDVTCQVHVLDGDSLGLPGARTVIALVVPLLSRDLSLTLKAAGQTIWSGVFSTLGSKVASRLLTKRKPALAAALRGVERRQGSDATHVEVTEIWPAGGGCDAWRVRVTYPTGNPVPRPRLKVQDGRGRMLDAPATVMEDHVVPVALSTGTDVRLVSFSVRVPAAHRHLCLTASLEGDPTPAGFCCLLPYQAEGRIGLSRSRIGGAGADPRYHEWFLEHRASRSELAAQRDKATELPADAPRFSIVAPEGCAQTTLASLDAQTYPRWELVHDPAQATGSHLVLIGAGGTLEPDCLWRFWEQLSTNPGTELLSCDSDVIEGSHHCRPAFKPAPNYDKLLSHDYLGYPLVVDARTYARLGIEESTPFGLLGYEAALRAFEHDCAMAHVARVLYHATPHELLPSDEAARAVVAAHLARRGLAATVEPGAHPHTNHVCYQLPEPAPHVSIVIPSKDHADLLRTCVTSILDHTSYPSFDIVVVENNSVEPETFAYYDEISHIPCVRVVTWVPGTHAENGFNYSAIINHGARACTGELLVFLNNDTEVIADGWLHEMAGLLTREDVGLVGAKLLFGDDLIQHAGLAANPNCDFLHPNQNLTADEPGYLCSAGVVSDMPMVTGACQMVSRSLYEQLGGYDEQLAVGFNDGDFCLRVLESGHRVVFTPYALLHHREFSTRGREANDVRLQARYLREKAYLMTRHADFLAAGDPTVNANLDRFSPWRELVH